MRVGLVGCGEVGCKILTLLARSGLTYTAWVYDRHPSRVVAACAGIASHVPAACLEELFEARPTYLVEAASREFLHDEGARMLTHGINLICLSNGALYDTALKDSLLLAAAHGSTKVYAPAGPPGLSTVNVLREFGITSAAYISSRGMEHPIAQQKGPGVYFSGSAAKAMETFPKSLNPAAALAEIGKGYDQTGVHVEFSNSVEGYLMELRVMSEVGELEVRLRGPLDATGRCAFWAAGSVVALLRSLSSNLVFGG